MSRTKNWWKSTSVLLVGGGCAAALAVFGRPAAGQQAVAPTVAVTLDDPVVVAQAPPELDRAEEFELPKSVCDYMLWGRWPRSLYRAEDLSGELSEWRFLRLPAGKSEWHRIVRCQSSA